MIDNAILSPVVSLDVSQDSTFLMAGETSFSVKLSQCQCSMFYVFVLTNVYRVAAVTSLSALLC